MSSEGKDPGPIWQGPTGWGQKQAFEHFQPDEDLNELPSIPPAQRAGGPHVSTPLPEEDTADQPIGQSEFSPLFDHMKQWGQNLAFVLVPLLFGALTGLIVLPLVAHNNSSVPADSLLIIVALIIVVMIAQSAATYFAGNNTGLWALTTVGGFCLFLLVGSFAIFGLAACLTFFIALIVLTIVGARFYFHPVREGTVDIVYAFGKYRRTLYPGINILLPREKVAHHVNVSETQWLCPMQRVQLSRSEDVHLRATISYQLMPEDAYLAATQVKNWEESLREYFLACLQNIATTFTPEDFIAWPQGLHTPPSEIEQADSLARRELVNRYLFAQMRDRVAIWGVVVNQVNIRDVVLAPHDSNIIEVPPPTAPAPEVKEAPEVAQPAPVAQMSLRQVTNSPKMEATPAMPSDGRVTPPRALSEEVLKKAYKEVQDGKITDPSTIRKIAARFQQVADDSQASQLVTFDAARAALNLYEQARKYEEHYQNGEF